MSYPFKQSFSLNPLFRTSSNQQPQNRLQLSIVTQPYKLMNPSKNPSSSNQLQNITNLDSSEYTISQCDSIEILDEVRFMNQVGKVNTDGRDIEALDRLSEEILIEIKAKDKPVEIVLEEAVGKIQSTVVQVSENDTISQPDNSSQSLPSSHQRLCCRTYFIKGQRLCPQSRSIQYKHYKMSAINQFLENILAKTIAAFLNTNGGNIFIGVHETQQFQRFVVGARYTQTDKENIHRKFRELAQKIKPDVITCQLFEVSFIPVVKVKNGFIKPINGMYVIKISVQQGDPMRLYTVLNPLSGFDEVCFRTETEVLTYKQMHEGFRFLEDRLRSGKRLEKYFPHENPCSVQMQKREWKALMNSQKKGFKMNTRLEAEKKLNNKDSVDDEPKRLIIRSDPLPVMNILGKADQPKPDELKQLPAQITEEKAEIHIFSSPKELTREEKAEIPIFSAKESTTEQSQKFTSSVSPFLFRQENQQEELTEPINY